MKQSEAMMQWAGDNWLKRNKPDLGSRDQISNLLDGTNFISPNSKVLEIGCANGWRLKKLRDKYGCEVFGVEPSEAAWKEAKEQNIWVDRGIAASLPYKDAIFDVVIMGFCMWLTEPSEWFRNVAESDRVLKDGGVLIIHDYCEPRPMKRPYNYDEEASSQANVWNYFFDWPKLWLAHPAYQMIAESMTANREIVSALRKGALFA
jgi:SAM-dependent methyltransferase